jgi:hypothetical protein
VRQLQQTGTALWLDITKYSTCCNSIPLAEILKQSYMKRLILVLTIATFWGCSTTKKIVAPLTQGDPKNAVTYGYQPIDPLPVNIKMEMENDETVTLRTIKLIPDKNKRIMASLPDETMRLAIGQIDGKGNASFATAKLGYAGSSYIVILDYIKFDTKSLPVIVKMDSLNQVQDFKSIFDYNTKPDAIIPVYVGVGLRFTATITVNQGSVDLGNLFALGLAAEAKKVTGTLIIQTLGISGKDISALIPMPSQINTTTIQNAIMSLASIKAKIYDDGAELNPRVVGFYNNIGGGQTTVQKFITNVLAQGLSHEVRN